LNYRSLKQFPWQLHFHAELTISLGIANMHYHLNSNYTLYANTQHNRWMCI